MSDKDGTMPSSPKRWFSSSRGPDGKRQVGRGTWLIGGVIGLAFGIFALVRGLNEAFPPNDPDAQASKIEARVLASNPPMALVARHEPVLWQDAHRKLVTRLHDNPGSADEKIITDWLGPLNGRIKQGAVGASDAKVQAIFGARLALLDALQAANLDGCKAYVTLDLKGLAALDDSSKQLVRSADKPLYDAYEEGVDHPTPALLTEAQADAVLTRLQNTMGLRLSAAQANALGGTGTAAEVCDAARRFAKVLAASPAADSAQVIRFLLLRGT